ncbi:MAG: ATPase, T2SS/T4P/T4SS family [Clostridiales bacterium]|nr:ATPase, T2SS/T4P/T4SS family [Clostridiales bacterium]
MYIANNENLSSQKGILAIMPRELRRYMYRINFDEAYEIHMRAGGPLVIAYSDGFYFLQSAGVLTKSTKGAVRVTRAHIEEALELASKSSLYAKARDISEGFITVDGGHRIGICGSAVVNNGRVEFIKDVSSLCYRLTCEVKGAADGIIDKIYSDGDIKNTIIISPPGAGKTTLLRDIARQLSKKSVRVCIVDERSEIAAMNEGCSAFDLGDFTDVLNGVKKSVGMLMAIRAMAPDVIITDELGAQEDISALEKLINSGVKIITSIHGYNLAQVKKRGDIKRGLKFFELAAELSKRNGAGTIENVIDISEGI